MFLHAPLEYINLLPPTLPWVIAKNRWVPGSIRWVFLGFVGYRILWNPWLLFLVLLLKVIESCLVYG